MTTPTLPVCPECSCHPCTCKTGAWPIDTMTGEEAVAYMTQGFDPAEPRSDRRKALLTELAIDLLAIHGELADRKARRLLPRKWLLDRLAEIQHEIAKMGAE